MFDQNIDNKTLGNKSFDTTNLLGTRPPDFKMFQKDEVLQKAHSKCLVDPQPCAPVRTFQCYKFSDDAINDFSINGPEESIKITTGQIKQHQETVTVYFGKDLIFDEDVDNGIGIDSVEQSEVDYLIGLSKKRVELKQSAPIPYHLVYLDYNKGIADARPNTVYLSQNGDYLFYNNVRKYVNDKPSDVHEHKTGNYDYGKPIKSDDLKDNKFKNKVFKYLEDRNIIEKQPELPHLNRLKFTATSSNVYYVAGTVYKDGKRENRYMKEECVLVSQAAINLNISEVNPCDGLKSGLISIDSNESYVLNEPKYYALVARMVRIEVFAFKEQSVTDVVLSMRGTGYFGSDFKGQAKKAYATAVVKAYLEFFEEQLKHKPDSAPQYYLASTDKTERDAFQAAIDEAAKTLSQDAAAAFRGKLLVINRTQSQVAVELLQQKKADTNLSHRIVGLNNAGDVLSVGGHGCFDNYADTSNEECHATRTTLIETQDPQKNKRYLREDTYVSVPSPKISLEKEVGVELGSKETPIDLDSVLEKKWAEFNAAKASSPQQGEKGPLNNLSESLKYPNQWTSANSNSSLFSSGNQGGDAKVNTNNLSSEKLQQKTNILGYGK